MKEPRRAALGVLYELAAAFQNTVTSHRSREFSGRQRKTLEAIMRSGVNSPLTTSAGRLSTRCRRYSASGRSTGSKVRRPWNWSG